ncbi:MAG TPA: amino acid ABC transporter substrate-binding protein [Roseiflexaceae bacterium]|nr:amino acid ABC transporter substrate-binding protein [Roseiflexaceae bacterium]
MQQRLWKRRCLALCLAVILLLAACGAPRLGGSVSDGDTIVFGATLSITGKTAKEGEYARDGYVFFIDSINERGGIRVGGKTYKLKLKYYNDDSRPERAAELFEKLINEDDVNFLLGPYGSAPTAAIAPIAEKYKLPLVTGHGSAGSIYSTRNAYTFNIQTPAKNYLHGIIDLVLEKDPEITNAAVLSEDDPFSKEVAEGAVAYAQMKGLDVVYKQIYPSNTQNVSALLAEVKRRNVDLLLGAGHLQDALLIVKQAKDLGVSPKAVGLSVGPSSPEFRATLGKDADYIFGATQWTSALEYTGSDIWSTPAAFADAFRARYPNYTSVPYQTAESTAALLVFQQALEQAGTLDPQKVRDALAKLETTTFFGRIAFDERGVNSGKPMVVVQLQPDGNMYTVFPSNVAEQAPLYPMPPWDQR